jgi:hypothetical protein
MTSTVVFIHTYTHHLYHNHRLIPAINPTFDHISATAITAMKSARDLQLPPELWCLVLSNVDNLTLWTSCRRVNKLFRAEAEREFAKNRLKYLQIRSFAKSSRRYLSAPVITNMDTVTDELVSVDGDRATFLVSIFRDCVRVDNSPFDPDMNATYETPGVYGFIHRSLSNSDRHVRARLGVEPELEQECYFGDYTLDAPLLNLDFDTQVVGSAESTSRISFDWKPLLDNLLNVYAQSQRQAQFEGCTDLDVEVMMAHLRAKYKGAKSIPVLEYCAWNSDYGSVQSRNCFQDAYAQRITRFQQRNHLHSEPNLDRTDWNVDEKAWRELEEYIDDCIEKRNCLIVQRFMSDNNIGLV